MSWIDLDPALGELEPSARAELGALSPMDVPGGAVLFSPGESVKGYVIVLSGRVGVHLLGPTGRDILLYEVIPGQSCIQSTLGLLGDDAYSAEAVAEVSTKLVLLPRATFQKLVNDSPGFRQIVFKAFAGRMRSMMQLIESVSFMRVEVRLATLIRDRANPDGGLRMTQAEMAVAIGSAREVISRRLDKMARAGIVEHGRGELRILNPAGLLRMIKGPSI